MIHINPMLTIQKLTFDHGNKKNFNIGSIGINSYINSMDLQISSEDETVNIQIGNYCSIAYNILVLINRNHDYKSITTSSAPIFNGGKRKIKQKGQILIGNDVWIGNDVILLSGIKIGNGAVIGAGTVVSKDVPPYAIVVGNPMKIVKYRFDTEQIDKLQRIKWWNWDFENIEKNKDWFQKDLNEFINKFHCDIPELDNIYVNKRNKSILFIPDFNEPYPIWKKVINEYTNKYTDKDDITLVLRIPQDDYFNKSIEIIEKTICSPSNMPDILILNDIITDERALFNGIDAFITTRDSRTMKYVEMATDFNVKILSGVDIPIFD